MIQRKTTRCHDWQLRLEACVRLHWSIPFAWGVNDCCTFVCAALEAVTGVNPLQAWTDTYKSDLGAARVLRTHGGVRTIASRHLSTMIPVSLAQPGDIGVFTESAPNAIGEGLAVWCGSAWLCPGEAGLKAVHPAAVTGAWRCCRD